MTGPGPRSRMTMRAQVDRDTTTATDGYNHPGIPVWTKHIAKMPCYVWTKRRAEIVDGRKVGMKEEIMALIPSGTDITEKDRITSVKDRLQASVLTGPLGIEAVMIYDTHLELTLTRIEGP